MAVYKIALSCLCKAELVLESDYEALIRQQSQEFHQTHQVCRERLPTTEPPMKEESSAVGTPPPSHNTTMADIIRRTPLSRRLHGVLTEAERTHAEQCLECQGRLETFRSSLSMHVLAAAGTTLTSPSQESSPSVEASVPVLSQ